MMQRALVRSVQPAWVAGIADFGGEPAAGSLVFPPLPGAREEVEAGSKIIRPKPQLLAPEQMTKSFLLDKMNAPRILHLATHGYYRSDSGGGLALKEANVSTQNILTQNDVARLRLLGTQLAVLSACESGVGEVSFADGLIGLQRSLTLAGARSQILTLWPVDDVKTRELMVAFYGNLFDKGMTKSEALRQAQLAMVREGLDMYYWAAFVHYGDSGPLGE
ncbi:MAG: CHAT domain-containing protein [Bryobacterales bacterium]|nr:CHAT domain-containing protein [Bryobacterales bacterium]